MPAKAKGADVSADDFEFKNWNPMENYTADLYKSKMIEAGCQKE